MPPAGVVMQNSARRGERGRAQLRVYDERPTKGTHEDNATTLRHAFVFRPKLEKFSFRQTCTIKITAKRRRECETLQTKISSLHFKTSEVTINQSCQLLQVIIQQITKNIYF